MSFDGSGLIAVRPGNTASGAADGVAYFSPDGRTWQYAGTIDAAGGWSPDVVKGSDYGFVVTGPTPEPVRGLHQHGHRHHLAADRAARQHVGRTGFIATVGPGGTVVAAGSTNRSKTSQQALFVKADTAGDVQPVSLTAIPGGLIPEEAVKSTAVAGNVQIAVGSADGYPAVWRRVSDGAWALVSSLAQVSADPDLAGLSAVTHGPHGWLAAGPGLRAHLGRRHDLAARRSHHARPGRRVRRAGGQRTGAGT